MSSWKKSPMYVSGDTNTTRRQFAGSVLFGRALAEKSRSAWKRVGL